MGQSQPQLQQEATQKQIATHPASGNTQAGSLKHSFVSQHVEPVDMQMQMNKRRPCADALAYTPWRTPQKQPNITGATAAAPRRQRNCSKITTAKTHLFGNNKAAVKH
jgi:hypothetical protein